MPLLIASLALLALACSLLIATLAVIIGWLRQDLAIRRMKRETAARMADTRSPRQ